MSNTIKGTGEYTDSTTGKVHTFHFDYTHHATMQEAIDNTEDEGELLALVNRMAKTDARNRASAKAQASNGHNQRVVTAEQKEANKVKAKAQRSLYSALAGKSEEELLALGLEQDVVDAILAVV